MSEETIASLSLFCASLEKEVQFSRLEHSALEKVIKLRNKTVFFTEYARIVVYAVLGKERADGIWKGGPLPKVGGAHALFELYWISVVINPELSWAHKKDVAESAEEKEERRTKVIGERPQLSPLKQRLPNIEKFLKENVVGQDEAVEATIDILYRAAAGLSDPDRPQAVLLFTGPSGAGKTHLAKTLCAAIFDENPSPDKISNPPAFMRIDCTLYQQKHEISNLTGSPQGYIGSDLGSPLPDFLRENSTGNIILIDEVEKAHQSLHKMFMGLFDYGKIKDNKQSEAEAKNTIFILTSNAGSSEAQEELGKIEKPLGFVGPGNIDLNKLTKETYKKRIENLFAPEFRGRLDEIIIFQHLNEESYKKILELELERISRRLQSRGISLKVTPSAKQSILSKATSPQLGARMLSHYVRDNVTKPLSRMIVTSESKKYICGTKDGVLYVEEV